MKLRKWDIVWAALDPTRGHEQAGRRPALIFSNDTIAAAIGLTALLPLTSLKKGRRIYPTEALLPETTDGLSAPSLVLGHQVRTVATSRLSAPIGRLRDEELQHDVECAVRLWLDMELPRKPANF